MTDQTESARPDPAEAMLRYFDWEHLPSHLQVVSAPFRSLAEFIVGDLPGGLEKTTALRKLLEAKDCAVRSALDT